MTGNLILVHCHDIGRHLGIYDARVATPNIDRLGAHGTVFEEAFSAAPLCSPARGALMTGRYPHANGINGLVHLGWEYADGERTLAHLLDEAGFDTTLVGLQHESTDSARLGYREVIDLGSGDEDPPYCGPVTDAAINWLEARGSSGSDTPFFLTVGFYEAHRPYPTQRYRPDDPRAVAVPPYLPDNPWTRDDIASLHGSIRSADEAVGRLMDSLAQQDFAADTWVVFTTDHGLAFPRAKSTLYEPGVGVAFIVRPPALVPGRGRTARLFSHVDAVPTFLSILGVEVPPTVQGKSHAAFLLDGEPASTRDEIFCEKSYHDDYDPIRAVRTTDWAYIRNFEPRPRLSLPLDLFTSPTAHGFGSAHLEHRPDEELYDLHRDPAEIDNLVDDPRHRRTLQDLRNRLEQWQIATDDPVRDRPIPPVPVPRLARYGALDDYPHENR